MSICTSLFQFICECLLIAALLNPHACIEAKGVNALMRNLVENVQVQASEAVLGVIFYLINDPLTRDLMKDDFGLEVSLATFWY